MHAIHYRYADVQGQRLFYREAGASEAPAGSWSPVRSPSGCCTPGLGAH